MPAIRCLVVATAALTLVAGFAGSGCTQPAASARRSPPATASASSFPHENSDLAPDPAVTWGRLANGLRWCAMTNQQPREKISIRLQVQSGSLLETEAQRGLAHYLEHLAFNGTTHYPPGELNKRLQPLGIAFGTHSNAHTSFDETVYKLDLPDAKPETLALGLEVVADFAGGMLLLPAEIEHERGVIQAEMRDRDSPGFRQRKATFATIFPGLSIAQRFPIGEPETVQAATPALIRDYYETWYRPERMVLAVVGAVDAAAARAAIETAFAGLAARAPVRPETSRGDFVPAELAVLHHHEAEAKGTELALVRVQPETKSADTRARRRSRLLEDVGERILDRRLTEYAERHPDGPLISGDASVSRWLDLRIAEVSADVRPGSLDAAVGTIEQELRRFLRFGPTAAELAVVRADVRTALDAAVAQRANRPNSALASYLYDAVFEGDVVLSPEQGRDLLAPWLDGIGADEVRLALVTVFGEGHRALTVSGREPRPADADQRLRAAWTRSSAVEVSAPAEEAAATWAYATRPPARAVAAETTTPGGIVQVRYANHARANLLRTEFKPGEVLIALRLEIEPARHQAGLRELASAAFLSAGLGKHSQQELRTVLAGTSARLTGLQFSDDAALLTATCLPKDLESALQQLLAYLTDPGWRPEAEAQAKAQWLQALAGLDTDLDAQTSRRFTSLLVADAPQRRQATPGEAAATSFTALKAWFGPILTQAPLSLSIVGDLDVAAARSLVAAYVGSLPERRALAVWTGPDQPLTPAPAIPSGDHRVDVPGKVARALVLMAWPTDDFYDIGRNRRLGVLAQAMGERLRDELREKLGQAYSPSVGRQASEAYEGFGYLVAQAGVAPEHIDAARAAMLAVAEDLARKGVDQALLDQVKPPLVKNLGAQRQQNSYWLGQVLMRSQQQPFRIAWAQSMEADFAAVTPAELSALAARYLVGKPLVVVGACAGDAATK